MPGDSLIDDQVPRHLTEAREAHRAGRLGVARAAYEALLETAPDDADARGLLGVLALQEGRPDEAEALLRQAVTGGGEARVHLRNLNNLLALLQQAGDAGAAHELVAGDPPDWPEGVLPDASGRETVLSLCRALLLLDRAPAAHRLLDRAIPDPAADAEALGLKGRILLALGAHEPAAEALTRAAGHPAADPQTLLALGHVQEKLGQSDAARATMRKIATANAVYSAKSKPSQRATVLVLNPTPLKVSKLDGGLHALHFASNFTGQFASVFRDEFRFVSMFPELPSTSRRQSALKNLPKVDVILNNCINPETMNVPGRLDPVIETVKQVGRPVINHPDAVFATTRQKVHALLVGIPNLKMPRIERYRMDLAPSAKIATDIEDRFGYPVIIRKCQAHSSAKLQYSATDTVAVLAEDGDSLRTYLTTIGWQEIYAVEYVPLRKKSGQFRRIRAILAEDEVIVSNPGYAAEWMASSGRVRKNRIDYYRAHPEITEEARRIVMDPEKYLGADCLRTLEAIRDRMPMDLCGVDFDVDDSGQVIFFEANAAMIFLKRTDEPKDITLPDAPFDRIKAAFRRTVDRRIGGRG